MQITIEAVFESGVFKPTSPVPLKEHEKVRLTVESAATSAEGTSRAVPRSYGLIGWTGPLADLDYLIEDVDNDPSEGP